VCLSVCREIEKERALLMLPWVQGVHVQRLVHAQGAVNAVCARHLGVKAAHRPAVKAVVHCLEAWFKER